MFSGNGRAYMQLPEVFLRVCFEGRPEANPGHTGGFMFPNPQL